MSLEAGSGVKAHYCKVQLYNKLRPGTVVGLVFRNGTRPRRPRPRPAVTKRDLSWSAPLAGKPSTRGQFGFPAETGAAPMTGAPAAHCSRLIPPWSRELSGQRPETS